MNKTQRQLLSDRINQLSYAIDDDEQAIAGLEARLTRARKRLAENKAEMAELREGVDW